jgi:hypothetical protein
MFKIKLYKWYLQFSKVGRGLERIKAVFFIYSNESTPLIFNMVREVVQNSFEPSLKQNW